MEKIVIRPGHYPMFGQSEGSIFCFVTNSSLVDRFEIQEEGSYTDYKVVTFDPGQDFNEILLTKVPEPAHVLVITPECYFASPTPKALGKRRKLAAMISSSTPRPLEVLPHFLKAVEETDVEGQATFTENFFEIAEASDYLEFVDEEYGTKAKWDHWDDTLEWFEQGGFLDWGTQQLVPSGEISILPLPHTHYDHNKGFRLNGELTFKGGLILHSGKLSFLPEDQERIYQKLSTMEEYALIATIEDGWITKIRTANSTSSEAAKMLEAMYGVESRYRRLWEIGFGINFQVKRLPHKNLGFQEVYGGSQGVVHWGFGLTPWTQYHFDIFSKSTKVVNQDGKILIGGENSEKNSSSQSQKKLARTKTEECPCL